MPGSTARWNVWIKGILAWRADGKLGVVKAVFIILRREHLDGFSGTGRSLCSSSVVALRVKATPEIIELLYPHFTHINFHSTRGKPTASWSLWFLVLRFPFRPNPYRGQLITLIAHIFWATFDFFPGLCVWPFLLPLSRVCEWKDLKSIVRN